MAKKFFISIFSKVRITFLKIVQILRLLEQVTHLEFPNHTRQKSEENVEIDWFDSDPFLESSDC